MVDNRFQRHSVIIVYEATSQNIHDDYADDDHVANVDVLMHLMHFCIYALMHFIQQKW